MALFVVKVPPEMAALGKEPCCFCFTFTNFWYRPKDVAVCKSCAIEKKPSEVPSKKMWCAAVRSRKLVTQLGICV